MNPVHDNPSFRIVEIFASLQGEGYNTGMPSVFIRLGKCNLACPWCDTNYHQFTMMPLHDILETVANYQVRNIIITGGEPTIQPQIDVLLTALKAEGYFLALESNGLLPAPKAIDYVAVSPKAMYAEKYRQNHIKQADEVRIVVDGDVQDFCTWVEKHIHAKHYYLSPLDDGQHNNLLETLTQLGQLNERIKQQHWQLSLQTHKLVGIE